MSEFDKMRDDRQPMPSQRHAQQSASAEPAPRSPVLRPADYGARYRNEAEEIAKAQADLERKRRLERDYLSTSTAVPAEKVEAAAPPPPTPPPQVPPPASQPLPAPTPLLDLRSGAQSVWDRRLLVLVLAVAGALAGGFILPRLPQKFTANASLYFDPRQIGLADPSAQNSTPPADMISATIDSKVQILTSGNVLTRVAKALNLDQDPEFNAGRTDGAAVLTNVKKALTVTREGFTYVVSLTATTKDAQKSAQLANEVIKAFMAEEADASGGLYDSTTATLDNRLNDLRAKVQEAEQAVENYRAENDMAATSEGLISDQRLASLNNLLVTAQERTIQAKAKADAASHLNFESVVSGSPANQDGAQTTNALSSLRQQYATQAATVSSLQSQLGARHPRLLAARSSLDSIGGQIRDEIQRLVNATKADYDQAKKAEDAIAKQLAVQKSLQATTSDKQVELNELQRKAAAARDLYETVLKRSGQTSEERNLVSNNIRVLSQAEPPVKANGPGKTSLLVAGVIGGFFGGFGLGAVLAVLAGMAAHPTVRGFVRRR
ncbi:GumC family protein [Oryzifoliimicrobium ureilyticus]|uniref:GumC family protein n=1 Tax=Oryzifoliimicrobium ureilyticus TaxID=3113724 RepID=UPI003076282F